MACEWPAGLSRSLDRNSGAARPDSAVLGTVRVVSAYDLSLTAANPLLGVAHPAPRLRRRASIDFQSRVSAGKSPLAAAQPSSIDQHSSMTAPPPADEYYLLNRDCAALTGDCRARIVDWKSIIDDCRVNQRRVIFTHP